MELTKIIEALLIASPEPVRTDELVRTITAAAKTAEAEEKETNEESAATAEDEGRGGDTQPPPRPEMGFAKITAEEVSEALGKLVAEYDESGRAFTVLERADGWKIYTRTDYAPWLRQLFPQKKPERLSAPALETLAIIAYRQPVTKAAIEAVRGVSVDGMLQKLLDRNIVRIAGRAELPGRPLLYETTELFFEHFGIKSVDDLPNASELRTIKLPEPEAPEEPGEEDEKNSQDPTGDGEEGDGVAVKSEQAVTVTIEEGAVEAAEPRGEEPQA